MARQKQIVIVIDESGNVNSEVVCGDGGETCLSDIDALLGDSVRTTETRRKPEFYQRTRTGSKVRQTTGGRKR